MNAIVLSLSRLSSRFWIVLAAAVAIAGCSASASPNDGASREEQVASTSEAVTTEDGLAEAYATFKQDFVNFGFDQRFIMGFGFHPALSTEEILTQGHTPRGSATLSFADQRVTAFLLDTPPNLKLDLWFVKNVAGSGRTVKPETGDQFLKVGTFQTDQFGSISLNVVLGNNINFDFDMVVLTRSGQSPTASRIAVGSRTLFEKRFFRERAGKTLDPVTGTLANNIETTDPLVQRGAQLFFLEQFAGNGRTCGTCHRAERSLTIDAKFIATLPKSDALFVAETNPALAALEDPTFMRQRGLIRENVDGFDDPTHKFVARGVPHTLALGLTNNISSAFGGPPDQRLGWGGDGAPGRGTLNEFSFGAVFQHFTKTLSRRPGVDFRIPAQDELDALEAFQLFSGRQRLPVIFNLQLRDAGAANGKNLFFGQAQCTICHSDLSQSTFNGNFNTGVVKLTPDLPVDDGFLDLSRDFGSFNVPPLIEAADTGPLFHNNSVPDLEGALAFYTSTTFSTSPSGFVINLTLTEQANVAAFLRVLNAAENMREVRKRVQFVRDHRSSGNTSLLTAAIADSQDAIDVLSAKGLNAAAVSELRDIKQTLQIGQANADADRPAFMDHALTFLSLAKGELFSANPDNEF
jgi:cytochrome c peroxidase